MGSQRIVIRTRRVSDIAVALISFGLGGVLLWSATTWGWHLEETDLTGVDNGELVLALGRRFGPVPLVAGFGMLGLYCVCIGLGCVWRLVDRRPAIEAGESGIFFHPSLHPSPVPWAEIRSIRLSDGSPPELRIELARRFWSLTACLSARTVKLNIYAAGLGPAQAGQIVQAMQGWLD